MTRGLLQRTFKAIGRQMSAAEKERPIPLSVGNTARVLYFYEHLRTVQPIDGSVVECGVGWGRSLLALAICLRALGRERRIYGFDSFEGFPEPTVEDAPGKARRGHYKTSHQSVIQFLINSGLERQYVDCAITLVPGYFQETLSTYQGGPIAFLHLDVDIYASYKQTLEHFYDLVAPGGVIAFDEYQSIEKYPGARRAIDEFFSGRRERIQHSPVIDRYYTIKT